MIVTALAGTLLLPLWLLVLGPLVWGVPHVVADLRYLVVRTDYCRRRALCWLAGAPLLWIAGGGDLVWGFFGAAAVALVARADRRRRATAVSLLGLAGAGMAALGAMAEVVFGHLHNFAAVGLWWLWRERGGRAHRWPLALLVAAVLLLLSPVGSWAVAWTGGLERTGAGVSAEFQRWRLAPGVDAELGARLVLLFCFAQSLHYAVWLQLIPDDDRRRDTPPTFRASYAELRRDLGDVGLVLAALFSAGLAVWAVVDLAAADRGYFRMARFHGHLELMAATLMLLERPARRG
ncbi:hypothetical protein [Nannocystis punicea]|uniref:Uncharacterized protein n=1 Tax=Nannocystis punicea TaxID=2995304 RepID=A0ABY7GU33_9BACT|nr:hypothetical protein [Nannocystis poenicansa]WAS90471.1 hypothetical protein O0S08_30145 [Nannocystis poenicansa]